MMDENLSKDKIKPFIARLGHGLDLTGEEIADILWLALKQREFSPSILETVSSLDIKSEYDVGNQKKSEIENQQTVSNSNQTRNKSGDFSEKKEQENASAKIFSDKQENASTKTFNDKQEEQSSPTESLPLRIPDPPSLREPLEFAKALRPLMRKFDFGRKTILDEIETVNRIASERICFPVLKSEPEPWLDLALVIDENKSMLIWGHTIKELKHLLQNYGIFREVRIWGLGQDQDKNITIHNKVKPQKSSGSIQELIDPTARRLILIVSDCIGRMWHDGSMLNTLADWSKRQPMAIVQMLPDWQWIRTGLRLGASVELANLIPGGTNQTLLIKELLLWKDFELEKGIKVPVLTLEPSVAQTWGELLVGKGDTVMSGIVFPPEIKINSEQLPQQRVSNLDAKQRVNRFSKMSSPMGCKLAGLMAAAPVITLPVVRLIQETMLPQCQPVHVAEVFLGGLLEPLTDIKPDMNPDRVEFGFKMDEIWQILLDEAPVSDSEDVFDVVSAYIEKQLGTSLEECVAFLNSSSNDNEFTKMKAFAKVSLKKLKQLGGEYKKYAQDLEEKNLGGSESLSYFLQNLNEHLERKNWLEADRETARILLRSVNREQEGWLNRESIQEIPCSVLKEIDQMWIAHSKGRFGFSIQRRNSINCSIDQIRQKNGWSLGHSPVGDIFVKAQFNFSENAPKGHLPTDRYLVNFSSQSKDGKWEEFRSLYRSEYNRLSNQLAPQAAAPWNQTSDIHERYSNVLNEQMEALGFAPLGSGDGFYMDVNDLSFFISKLDSCQLYRYFTWEETEREILLDNKIVELEYSTYSYNSTSILKSLHINRHFLSGYVRVKNVPLQKKVVIHYSRTRDEWLHQDAVYSHDGDDEYEFWKFNIVEDVPQGEKRELFYFAIQCFVNGKEYWDSNNGNNYDGKQFNPGIVRLSGFGGRSQIDGHYGVDYDFGGKVWVKNIAFEKKITIHYSFFSMGGPYWNKIDAQYLMQGKNGYEIWEFNGKVHTYKGGMQSFAIQYEVGGKEYWDNNLNRNYPINPSSGASGSFSIAICVGELNGVERHMNLETKEAQYITEILPNDITLDMVYIPGNTFMMGSPEDEGNSSEHPQHQVIVSPFFMGKYPITQEQWRAIASLPKIKRDLKPDPSHFKGDSHPVEQVSWYDAVEFCQRLSKQTGTEYRLPSEAEWEYACRDNFRFTDQLADYNLTETVPVGQFSPNTFGLYDMRGNVWEWCQDNWHDSYEDAPTDGSAWLSGDSRRKVKRGGSWLNIPSDCRSEYRGHNWRGLRGYDIGFRVVCVAPIQ